MLGLDRNAARYTWTAALVLLTLFAVYKIRQVLFLLIVAVLLSYLLYPVVTMLVRWLPGRSRKPALAIVFLLVMALLGLAVAEIGSVAAEQASSLAQRAPEFLKNLKQQPTPSLPAAAQTLKQQALDQIANAVRQHYDEAVGYLPHLLMGVLAASSNLIYLVVVPILSFFLLKDSVLIRAQLMRAVPTEHKHEVDEFMRDVHQLLLQYVRSLFFLGLATFTVFAIVLSLFGVSYGLLLAVIAFPLEFIPMVGPLIAAALILTVAAVSGYPHLLWIVLFLGVYRMFQDYVVAPRLMSEGVEVPPLLVILGVFAGERLGGVPGMFLSVPVIALMRIIYLRLVPR